jgi:flagellar biosynthetic protein FlhB
VSEDRTEAPTPKRRRKAREKGQVARSAELVGSGILLGLFWSLPRLMPRLRDEAGGYWVRTIAAAGQRSIGPTELMGLAGGFLLEVSKMAGPVLGFVAAAALVTNVMQVGLHFNAQPLLPQLSRLDPLSGVRRLVTVRSAVELLKGVAKTAIVVASGWSFFKGHRETLLTLAASDPVGIAPRVGGLAYEMSLRMVATLAVLAAVDYAYQRRQLEQSLKMTKQAVKDEFKEAEGNPEIKSRIRQRQRETARRRMMAAVPRASVVVTNPTHFAVALEYEMGTGAERSARLAGTQKGAPKVVAKGQDLIALRIREIAVEHRIPLVENPPLARSLYQTVEIGEEIPPALYRAVAEVLALIWRAAQAA